MYIYIVLAQHLHITCIGHVVINDHYNLVLVDLKQLMTVLLPIIETNDEHHAQLRTILCDCFHCKTHHKQCDL